MDNLSLSIRCMKVIEALLCGVEVRFSASSPQRKFVIAEGELAELLPKFHLGLSPRREIVPQPAGITLGEFIRLCEAMTDDQYLLMCDDLIGIKRTQSQ